MINILTDPEVLIAAGILAAFIPLFIIPIRLRFGQGLAFRIFAVAGPPVLLVSFNGFILGKVGVTMESASILMPLGTSVAVLALSYLYVSSVVKLNAQTTGIQASVAQLSRTAKDSAATASQQAAMVAQVSSTVEEIHQTSTSTSEIATAVLGDTSEALERARAGLEAIDNARRAMDRIARVSALVDTINSLAEQSNLLAVNASIEAATAGAHGRGFSVVATEVRTLAEKSKEASRQIRAAILRTQDGQRSIHEIGLVVGALAQVLDTAADKAKQIKSTSYQQVSGLAQITEAMISVQAGGTEIAAGARQLEQATANLSTLGDELRILVQGSKAP